MDFKKTLPAVDQALKSKAYAEIRDLFGLLAVNGAVNRSSMLKLKPYCHGDLKCI